MTDVVAEHSGEDVKLGACGVGHVAFGFFKFAELVHRGLADFVVLEFVGVDECDEFVVD